MAGNGPGAETKMDYQQDADPELATLNEDLRPNYRPIVNGDQLLFSAPGVTLSFEDSALAEFARPLLVRNASELLSKKAIEDIRAKEISNQERAARVYNEQAAVAGYTPTPNGLFNPARVLRD